jgi:hypothetical protein
MTYRRFVPKSRILENGSATVATTATDAPEIAEVSQLSQVSQRSKRENTVSALKSVAAVAEVNSGISGFQPDLEERAALVEYGAGVPREWAEGFARLNLASAAPGFGGTRWQQVIDDGGRFLDRWASEAAQLGWRAVDIFGIHPLAPAARFDVMGLVPIINGGEVVAITERSATIQSPGGSRLVYMRRTAGGGVCLWELVR